MAKLNRRLHPLTRLYRITGLKDTFFNGPSCEACDPYVGAADRIRSGKWKHSFHRRTRRHSFEVPTFELRMIVLLLQFLKRQRERESERVSSKFPHEFVTAYLEEVLDCALETIPGNSAGCMPGSLQRKKSFFCLRGFPEIMSVWGTQEELL